MCVGCGQLMDGKGGTARKEKCRVRTNQCHSRFDGLAPRTTLASTVEDMVDDQHPVKAFEVRPRPKLPAQATQPAECEVSCGVAALLACPRYARWSERPL